MIASYKTHILLGLKTGGKAYEIARWEYSPTGPEVEAARAKELTNYNEFVLVAPVGDSHPGTYVEPVDHGGFCG